MESRNFLCFLAQKDDNKLDIAKEKYISTWGPGNRILLVWDLPACSKDAESIHICWENCNELRKHYDMVEKVVD